MIKQITIKPSLTVDAIVLTGEGNLMKVLLIRRKNDPFRGELAFPGGFVDPYEFPHQAVIRELQEETELSLPEYAGCALSLRSKRGRDPRGWTLTLPFLFWIPEEKVVKARSDAEECSWYLLKEVTQLSFDHGSMLCEALSKFWNLLGQNDFPHQFSQLEAYGEPSSLIKQQQKEWIIYGGSFNPLHDGHRACVSLGKQVGKVVVVPDQNPFKQNQNQKRVCSFDLYQNLLKEFHDDDCFVYPGFLGLERVNPTYLWWPKQIPSQREFSLLLGDDSFVSLHQWIQVESFISRVTRILLVPRDENSELIHAAKKQLLKLNPALKILPLRKHSFQHLSSRELRLKDGEE